MALKVYTSTDNQSLALELAKEIDTIKNVFQKHFIITGHNSTNDFLTQTIAEENDIAAYIEYKRALEFVEMVYSILEAGPKKRELFKSSQLVWLIDEVLSNESVLSKEEFKKIKEYIDGNVQKQFTLAEKIAGLFQSYQEDTPELIEAWNKNQLYYSENKDEAWQNIIWDELKVKLEDKFPDLTNVYRLISAKLKTEEGKQLIQEKLPSVSFYGNLPYTSSLVRLLKELEEFIDVTLFYVSFSGSSDYRLVKNFGQLSNKQQELLSEFEAIKVESHQSHSNEMLGELQKRIKGIEGINPVPKDDSITIASSFTVSREVEALYHYLVKQFERNNALMMRDICVVIPDVDAYAPAINAYFTNKNFEIKYTLYDTSHKIHASPYAALEALFRLEKDEFTSKRVMSLLDFDFIRNKYGINDDLGVLKRAVKMANIRHSIDGDSALETEYVSWRYGLKRLIYGFCLPPNQDEVDYADASFYPVDEFEEGETQEIMRLNLFIEELNEWLDDRSQERTLSEWVSFIADNTIEQFIDFKENDRNLLQGILSDLEITSKSYGKKVPYIVARYYLLNNLGQLVGGEKRGFGGIRFVSPNTYLSSPVKVFAFLGMNNTDFPRQDTRLSFDLSREDRITRTEMDKNLLLNILLFTQEKVYFSYIGQDVRNNSSIPPSTVLDELMAALKDFVSGFDDEKFIVKHPLHAFSSRYNSIEEPDLILYSADNNGKTVVEQMYKDNSQPDEVELPVENGKKVIQLQDLIRFIQDPVKHYFNKVMGIYFSDDETELEEVEPFELDTLESWAIKDRIVRAAISVESENPSPEQLKKLGGLPLSAFGDQLYKDIEAQVDPITHNEELKKIISNEKRSLLGNVQTKEYVIKGKVDNIFDDTLLLVTPSSDKVKRQIQAMMSLYFASAIDDSVSRLLYITKDGSRDLNLDCNDKIVDVLNSWCKLYEEGTKNMIYYSTEIIDVPDEIINNEDTEQKSKELNKFILDNNIHGRNAYPSEYLKLITKNDGFLDVNKADSFLMMYKEVIKLTNKLNN